MKRTEVIRQKQMKTSMMIVPASQADRNPLPFRSGGAPTGGGRFRSCGEKRVQIRGFALIACKGQIDE